MATPEPTTKVFLVVDDNADSRFLLVKTLQRKFPDALIREVQESEQAVAIATTEELAAIVAHRAADLDGISMIQALRAANPDVIILMVSGLDRTESAIRAGATCFLNYDEWLRVGSVVTDLLSRSQAVRAAHEDEQRETDRLRNAAPPIRPTTLEETQR
jgi:DNA-binding NtrC family response regulator